MQRLLNRTHLMLAEKNNSLKEKVRACCFFQEQQSGIYVNNCWWFLLRHLAMISMQACIYQRKYEKFQRTG